MSELGCTRDTTEWWDCSVPFLDWGLATNGKRPSKAVPCHGFGTLISLSPISSLSGSDHAASPCLLSHSEEPFVRCEQSPAQDGKLKPPGQIHLPPPMYVNTVLWEHPHSHQLQRPLVHKLEISTLSLSRKSLPQLGLKDPFFLELFTWSLGGWRVRTGNTEESGIDVAI